MSIRWGILGCGDIARKRVAQACIDAAGSELLAVWRRDKAKRARFCEDFGVQRSCADEAELIGDPDIDAVYIATPPHLHRAETVAAAAAGKHVLVEKPMARSTAECDEMIAACRAAGVKLGVAYYRRFYPIVRRMKEIIADGSIGKILSAGAVTSTTFAIGPGEDGYYRARWAEGGGGALMDVGSHRVNLLLDMFGPVERVKAHCDTVAGDYETDDCATLAFRFAAGMHGTLQCYFGTTPDLDAFKIIGTLGHITADPLGGSELVIERGDERLVESHPREENTHLPLIVDFVVAVGEDREPLVTGEEGRAASEVMERAYEDAHSDGEPPAPAGG